MISPNISMVPPSMRLPLNGTRTGGHQVRTSDVVASTSPPVSTQSSTSTKSASTQAGIKMTNFSIAGIMNNAQQNKDLTKLTQTLGI